MEFINLDNKDKSDLVDGVLIRPLKINQDESGGILVETLRKDWPDVYGEGREFSMQYFSVTDSGIARDEKTWHIHPTYQEDRFLLAQGEVVVAVADNRDNSSTKNLINIFHMSAYKSPYILLIPKNTLHGFLVVSDLPAILLNFPTGLYNPSEEGRILHEEVNIKMLDGSIFSWDLVRKEFPKLSS